MMRKLLFVQFRASKSMKCLLQNQKKLKKVLSEEVHLAEDNVLIHPIFLQTVQSRSSALPIIHQSRNVISHQMRKSSVSCCTISPRNSCATIGGLLVQHLPQ